MKKILVLVLFAVALFFPLSNLLGLQGKNEPITVGAGHSENFAKASAIMQDKCVDCHAPGMLRKPFYADFPVAKQLMEKDIAQASQRMVLTRKLFSGEDAFSPVMLARLEHVVLNDSMPPALYLTMHWTDHLSAGEKQTLQAWIAEERAKLPWSQDAAPEFKGEPVHPLPLTLNLDAEKVALGKQLFHDRRLSGDDTINCASCHDLTRGGTDQAKVSTGIRGQQGPINSPTVYDAMYNIAQFWDGRAKDLQEQAAGPVANPLEMGAQWDEVVEKLNQVPEYQMAFARLYPGQGLSKASVTDAIAVFEQSLVTANSRFDQYLRGNTAILSDDEKQGYALFKIHCASCHSGPALGGLSFEKMGVKHDYFKQRGGELTDADNGRFNVTKDEKDRHVFKVPVLRNIEMTFPYFHDGSTHNLAKAVEIMGKDQVDREFTHDETAKLVAFLLTLNGEYKGKPVSHLTAEDLK
ncbi:cytochrome c peroxidase [Methylomonas rapida]|uniref:Heme-binding domain-containing protein n=1 Tax=Methylomonas rapida TaxID=2963939 RepID=A0ABY7GME3_9GAMM|nr:cytochrome c peroxidase [Methylomonas rapida]WAR45665.1 heme-binding domain-containing protein [Methylomonas rapida]